VRDRRGPNVNRNPTILPTQNVEEPAKLRASGAGALSCKSQGTAMSRLIDHALLLALLVTMVGFIARIPSLVVDAVLMGAMTPVADALEHVLRMSTWRKG